MTDLDAHARAMLQAFRSETSPPGVRVESGLADVEARIVGLGSADDFGPEHGSVQAHVTTAPPSFYVKAASIAIAIAAGVLLTIRLAALGVAVLSRGKAPAHDAASDTPVRESAASRVETSVPVVSPPVVRPSAEQSTAPATPLPPVLSPAGQRSASSAPRPRDDLVAEVALLREAKAERDAKAALALLDEHAREFPSGSLERERDVLRAERLCTLGRTDEARELADRFVADRGSDPLAQRMGRVCRTE